MQHQNTFNRALKKFRDGLLQNDDAKRIRTSLFDDVKEKLLQYIELRAQLYKRDKCGLSWALLKEKALYYAEQLGHDNFRAGDYFIASVLKKGNKKCIALHGEGMEMSEEDKVSKRASFTATLRSYMERYDLSIDRVYNADQTGLFYNKLPNRIYIDKDEQDYRGVKQMKSKDRVTLMVASSGAGKKLPLFMVGKSKKPECFRLCGDVPPMAYIHQANAWFDKEVTIHWINAVLWPWHLAQHGNVSCLLLLDNCPAHVDLDSNKLPAKLVLLFFPPNCTSFLQPADMGMIACLKVGYKANMLKRLLAICDDDSLYEESLAAGERARRGCKGLDYCGKAHLLDAMEICVSIWNQNSKYAMEDSIRRCWRKAGLLTAVEEADLENDIGRATVPQKDKVISNDDCLELCNLFTQLQCKVAKHETLPAALEDCLISEGPCTVTELASIITNWIDIEDDRNVVEDDVLEAIEDFEQEQTTTMPILPSFDEFAASIEIDIEPEPLRSVSWTECLASCDIIKQFLSEKNMEKELIQFEQFQHKLRVKRIDAATSQLSIKSFFRPKPT